MKKRNRGARQAFLVILSLLLVSALAIPAFATEGLLGDQGATEGNIEQQGQGGNGGNLEFDGEIEEPLITDEVVPEEFDEDEGLTLSALGDTGSGELETLGSTDAVAELTQGDFAAAGTLRIVANGSSYLVYKPGNTSSLAEEADWTQVTSAGGVKLSGITSANNIQVTGNAGTLNLFLDGASLNSSIAGGALILEGSAQVIIVLSGSNTLATTANSSSGIVVPAGALLAINSAAGLYDLSGSLTATSSGGAGIAALGTLTINGGTITATGGTNEYTSGAGIGGTAGRGCGSVTINGGKVVATGGVNGAGIGAGGASSNSASIANGSVTINGGDVEAKGGKYSAGIGGGRQGNTGTIVINGGKVKATGFTSSSGGGAGIGGGWVEYNSPLTGGGSLTINGGAVYAYTGYYASAIGHGGRVATGPNIAIHGGTVYANVLENGTNAGGYGPGIGLRESMTLLIDESVGTTDVKTHGATASGIQAFDGNTITIASGTVYATSKGYGGIGGSAGGCSGCYGVNHGNDHSAAGHVPDNGGTIVISGGTVTAIGDGANPGIGAGRFYNPKSITISGGNVTAVGGNNGSAGIGSSVVSSAAANGNTAGHITITGNANVTATGGAGATGGAAGIGTGAQTYNANLSALSSIVIDTTGTVVAIGGSSNNGSGPGAGIGAGGGGRVGDITISNGTIVVTGGVYSAKGAQGIGTGYSDHSSVGTITISGAATKLTAYAAYNYAVNPAAITKDTGVVNLFNTTNGTNFTPGISKLSFVVDPAISQTITMPTSYSSFAYTDTNKESRVHISTEAKARKLFIYDTKDPNIFNNNSTAVATPVVLQGLYSLSLSSTTGGTASTSGQYGEGNEVQIVAKISNGNYVFTHWSVMSGTVDLADETAATTTLIMPSANVSLRANFEIAYTVRFLDHDGTVLSSQSIAKGRGAQAPSDPSRVGWSFTGWDKDFSSITGALDIMAQYSQNTYTVRFLDHDGTVLKTQTVAYGSDATAPADPSREGYNFTGWSTSLTNITSNTDVRAQYSQVTFTVRFLDYDGDVLKTQTVAYGGAASAPSNPNRTGYNFTGWDKPFIRITGNLDVLAQYTVVVVPGGPVIYVPTPQAIPVDTPVTEAEPVEEEPAATFSVPDIIDDIASGEVPLAAGESETFYWSLFNLIAVVLAFAMSIVMAVRGIVRSRKQKEEKEDGTTEEKSGSMRVFAVVLTILAAVGALVLFILTQNLTNPMAIFDSWSILFAVLLVVAVVMSFVAIRSKKKQQDDQSAAQPAWQ